MAAFVQNINFEAGTGISSPTLFRTNSEEEEAGTGTSSLPLKFEIEREGAAAISRHWGHFRAEHKF